MDNINLGMGNPNKKELMFIKTLNSRYKKDLWTYRRLVDASAACCLCTYCKKTDLLNNIICPKHEKFMRITEEMEIAGPIFACEDFEEAKGTYIFLNEFYDGDNLSSKTVRAQIPEFKTKLKEEWKAQKKKWADES